MKRLAALSSGLSFFFLSFSFSKRPAAGREREREIVSGLSRCTRASAIVAGGCIIVLIKRHILWTRVIIAPRNLVCLCMTKERIDKHADALVVTVGGGWVTRGVQKNCE